MQPASALLIPGRAYRAESDSSRRITDTYAEIIPVIETKNLTKRYGDLVAVNNINLKLDQGDVFGFIGAGAAAPACKGTGLRMAARGVTARARAGRSLRGRPSYV